jgi:hypothetical protein
VLFGLSRPKAREPDMTNVVDLQQERIKRMPIMFVGFMSQQDVLNAERRRAEDRKGPLNQAGSGS